MPVAGKSAAADAKKKATTAKTKEKKSSKDKDKVDKPKKKSDDKPKKKSEPTAASVPVPAPIDPDAVQLFRRYDRARAGVILRTDFLQLLRDYAHLPRASSTLATERRPPLSLTDSRGIPLGYERSDKNSEFEAGQLFERYDKDHAGALSLDKFGEFFRDFQSQLRGFVDELSYSASVHPLVPPSGTVHASTPPAAVEKQIPHDDNGRLPQEMTPVDPPSSVTKASLRAEYQATLWELRKICKDELAPQRERIRHEMVRLRARLASTPRQDEHDGDGDGDAGAWSLEDPYAFSSGGRGLRPWAVWGDNQLLDRYDALESDVERLDELLRVTRRQLRKGLDVSVVEMQALLKAAPELLADARAFAMKVYDVPLHKVPSQRKRLDERLSASPRRSPRHDSPRPSRRKESVQSEAEAVARFQPEETGRSKGDLATVEELQKTLRIKDQLIYQLLQERTTLRRQKATAESDLHDLSEVSTHEMRKWAQLTDDMQQEIALLRDQLSTLDHRRDDDASYTYTQRHA